MLDIHIVMNQTVGIWKAKDKILVGNVC